MAHGLHIVKAAYLQNYLTAKIRLIMKYNSLQLIPEQLTLHLIVMQFLTHQMSNVLKDGKQEP